MYEAHISTMAAMPAFAGEDLEPLRSAMAALDGVAGAARPGFAAEPAGSAPSIAARYAGAGPVARRRFDAMLREAETVGATGLRLVAGRCGRADAGTIAAARFLGSSLDTLLRRLDDILPPSSA